MKTFLPEKYSGVKWLAHRGAKRKAAHMARLLFNRGVQRDISATRPW
jgi:hypothetical protein